MYKVICKSQSCSSVPSNKNIFLTFLLSKKIIIKQNVSKKYLCTDGVLHPRKLRAPIITSIQLDSKYISVLCKWSNHGHQLSLPNLFTTVVLMDDKKFY